MVEDQVKGRVYWEDYEIHLVCKMLTEYRSTYYIGKVLCIGIDDKVTETTINNLIVAIKSGEYQDISKHYKIPTANAQHAPYKYSDEVVVKIMRGLINGKTISTLTKEYPEVSQSTIFGISSGRSYSHLIPLVDGMSRYMRNKATKLINTEKWAKEIMYKLISGERPVDLRDEYMGIFTYAAIKELSSGKTYRRLYPQVEGMQEFINSKTKKSIS